MNSAINISLTFKDMGMFVLWALLTGVLVYILMILIRFYGAFRKITKIMDNKSKEIDAILEELPGITQNVNVITGEVAHGMEAFHQTVDNLAETSDNVTDAIAEKSGLAGKFSSLMHTVSMLKSFYDTYFNADASEDDEETVMVCKEVPKSDFDMDRVQNKTQSAEDQEDISK